jgi:EAL domain-containing protein (putative c-di-GMP-specific phosphodiesterase class I)
LKEVARLLQKRVRETDTVARYGGDDFVILLWELASFREAIWIAKRIQEDLGCTKDPQGQRMPIKVSVGLDFLLDQKADPDDVVRNAHLAMSYAKAKGRNFLKVFSPRLLDQVRTSLALENEMERGIREGEFFLAFQPIVDAGRARRLAGLEALCRWRHPQRGVIPPGEFIPVAEESGLIVPLGKWVLDTAIAEMAAWRSQGRERAGVFVSVNLSARQLEKPDIVQAAREALGRHGLPPELLHLEITETSLMAGNAAMMEHIVALKGLGVRLAVDDFGTGYSNLSLLTRLNFSDLKVDRSLVMDVESKAENLAVIRAINTMAGSLGATVIVEGVETQAQGDILMGLGCNMQQGYLYSRPVPLGDIKA